MHAGELRRIHTGTRGFLDDRDAPIVVSAVRNEALRLPFMLEHYRALGFAGFLFLDNGSTDDTVEILEAQSDVVLHVTDASYAAASSGVDWQQYLLREFAQDRWALVVDADEQLVFPGDRAHGIRALIDRAERRGDAAVMAPLVDVYPAGPLSRAVYRPGHPFLSVADRFDGPDTHYLRVVQEDCETAHVEVRGGLRLRVMGFELDESPLLTKFPLARRCHGMAIENAHLLHPPECHDTGTFGALLHFKYFHDFPARAQWGVAIGEHWRDGYEYRKYVDALEEIPGIDLRYAGSRVYEGPESLDWLWEAIRAVWVSGSRAFVPASAPRRDGARRGTRVRPASTQAVPAARRTEDRPARVRSSW